MTRSVETIFTAKVDGYLANVTRMKAATADMAKSGAANMKAHGADWDKIGKASTVAGLAIGAAVVYSAKKYMDFEAAMSKVGAVANSTAKEQKALGEAALKAGQDTVFSAMQAAEAEAELLKAGISVSDVLGGALTGSLNLAAAGQIGLAQSAEIAAQAMNIFNLEGEDVGHIADVLTAGANKSAAGVDDLGMALAQGGLVAKQTGLTLEETVGTLSAFADNALKGSDAGTSMKTMLQRLNPTTTEAKTLMEELNLSAYDSQGNFVGLAEYAGQLQGALSGMTVEQRNATLATLFGSDAVRGANVLYEQGEAGMRKYIAAVDDQGAAARMAARQTDNLKGDLERLKGTLETVFIKAGSGGNDGIRSLVQGLESIVNGFNKLSPEAQAASVQVAAVTAAALLLAGVGIKVSTSVLTMKASMDAAGISGARLAMVLKGIGAGVAVGAVAAISNELVAMQVRASVADVAVDELADSLRELADTGKVGGGLNQLFAQKGGLFGSDEKIVTTTEAIERFAATANDALGDSLYSKIVRLQDMGEGSAKLGEYVGQIDAALAELVRSGNADQAADALERMLSGISDPAVRSEVLAQFTAYQTALDETAVAATDAEGAVGPLAEGTSAAGQAAKDAAEAPGAWADELSQINSPILDARDAARQFEAAVDDASAALKENGNSLDINTKKGRANQAALDGVARAALEQIGAMQANGASQRDLQKTLDTSRDRLETVARKFGMSKAEARAYADQVLKTPKAVTTTITAKTEAAKAAVAAFQSSLNGIQGKSVLITVRYNTVNRPNGGRDLQGGIVQADGGMNVKAGGRLVTAYAGGGTFDGSFAGAQPQIRSAGGRGVLWAEEGAGPWEGFVSGHPAKRGRSRGITEDIAGRLGGEVTWVKPMASGGTLTRSLSDQVRGLAPRSAGMGGPVSVTNIKVEIIGPVDAVAAGAQFECVLQDYTSVTGRPLQVSVAR
ncbi:MAG: phage tail tape measure protein [Pseudonocardia sp.]|nr:phage tail tape measure protein [Pseudonocardia sp.]